MAIDFLILALLLISFVINLLALCAFWVTPGLRTTANRFTINLLIINLIGCLILGPTLFLNNSWTPASSASGLVKSVDVGEASVTDDNTFEGVPVAALQANIVADSIEFYSKPGNHQMTIRHNGKLIEQDGIIVRKSHATNNNTQPPSSSSSSSSSTDSNDGKDETIETIYKCNSTYCRELTIDEHGDGGIVITEIEEDNISSSNSILPTETPTMPQLYIPPLSMRCWSIDMTAALGALAVLLVVGDTWMAVTDPLRYHSRISGVKTWIFIALVWAIGILFGAISAFRALDFESDTLLSKQQRFAATYFSLSSTNSIFDMVYASVYFVVIILLPFGFVCGMYWRIFSEARGNGLRMRQNGSSPLLQSALNLTHSQPTVGGLQYSNSLCVRRHSISSASSHGGGSSSGGILSGCGNSSIGGLHMQIDQRKSSPACLRRDSAAKVLLPTISDDGSSDGDSESGIHITHNLMSVPEHQYKHHQHQHQQQHSVSQQPGQGIVLTLQAASGEIKRNYSARQLPILGTSSQDLQETSRLQSIRQVHSSPNLQKYTQLRQDSLTDECGSPHLLGHGQLHVQNSPRQPHTHFARHTHHGHLTHQPHSTPVLRETQSSQHALQIPAIHASPKALSYMSSLRHRLSNASSLFKYREESRAARISILVVIMFLVSYLPFGLLVLLQSRLSAANFQNSSELAIFMILLANISSPFIFAYRNKRVRRGVKRLMGFDSHSSLQRHCSSSVKINGAAGGSSAQLQRNSSKLSSYSTNSTKYLTPQSSLISNAPLSTPLHTTLTLRPNSSCSTIINFGGSSSKDTAKSGSAESDDLPMGACVECQPTPPARPPRPKLQRGITIVEHIPISPPKFAPKRTIFFDMFFKGSKKLQSCAQRVKEASEPTEV